MLVVIIIIGILAAIALPSFLNQASKARQSEAKTYVGSMNRTQQAYYLEKKQFAPNVTILSVGIPATTANYSYGCDRTSLLNPVLGAYCWGIPDRIAAGYIVGTTSSDSAISSTSSTLKAYMGVVTLSTPAGSNEATTLATLCESAKAPVNTGVAISSTETSLYVEITGSAAPKCTTSVVDGTVFVAIQ